MSRFSQVVLSDPVRGGSEPDRFWTRTNTAEATPDLLTALEWDVFGSGLEQGFIQSMVDFGVLGKSERAVSEDPNERMTSVFYGRQAVNVGLLRQVLARLPGLSPDDLERDLLGSVRPGLVREASSPGRWPSIAVRLPLQMLGLDRRVKRLHADQLRWWQTEVLDVYRCNATATGSAIERLDRSSQRYASAFTVHSIVRFLLPVAEKLVHDMTEAVDRPDLTNQVLAGHGDLSEMALAKHIWEVGQGDRTLDGFVREYGFHGPRTGNLTAHSWREQPEQVERLAARMRTRLDIPDPTESERRAQLARSSATTELFRATPPGKRRLLKFALQRAGGLTRKLELGKAAYLMGLDGARAAARELGVELNACGVMGDPEDVFFLTRQELHHCGKVPSSGVASLISFRQTERVRYAQGEIPISFTGDPDLRTTVEHAASAIRPDTRVELTGAVGGGGVVHGRARIVLDSNDDVEFEAGDVLVCKFTDPSWTPLFMMASGVVIDIGSFSSHGAVVARELGIPYVIGTGEGTSLIREGDVIEVDGPGGLVRVLDRKSIQG